MFLDYNIAPYCYYCKRTWTTTVVRGRINNVTKSKDHVVAKNIGGPDWIINKIAACTVCNGAKGDKTLPEFAYWLEANNGFNVPGVSKKMMIRRIWKLYNKSSWFQKRYGISGHKGGFIPPQSRTIPWAYR